jgi:hypothetical protein
MSIAHTIIEQLGGNRFRAMTGARDFVAHDRGVSFRLPRGLARKGINSVVVQLDPSDTYTVMFNKRRGVDLQHVDAHTMVYADQLRQLFTTVTGLDTSL